MPDKLNYLDKHGLQLYDQLIKNYINTEAKIFYDTTAHWNSKPELITEHGCIYIYSDWGTSPDGRQMNNGDNAIQLYAGSLTKGNQTTISNGYGIYTSYIVVGDLSGNQPYGCVAVPKAMLTTSAARYQYADESNYTSFQMWYSGTTLYVKCDNSSNASGRILKVYGIH